MLAQNKENQGSIRYSHTLLHGSDLLLALLLLEGHIVDKDNITGASRLHRDGMNPEVLKHIENGLEPQI